MHMDNEYSRNLHKNTASMLHLHGKIFLNDLSMLFSMETMNLSEYNWEKNLSVSTTDE